MFKFKAALFVHFSTILLSSNSHAYCTPELQAEMNRSVAYGSSLCESAGVE